MGRFFITCDDASLLSTRSQYGELNPKDTFRHKLHKSHCIRCRDFHKKNDRFQRVVKGLKWVSMTQKQKEIIKKRIAQAMKKK